MGRSTINSLNSKEKSATSGNIERFTSNKKTVMEKAIRSHGEYLVKTMRELTQDTLSFRIRVSTLHRVLSLPVWETEDGLARLSPMDLIRGKVSDESHAKRFMDADLSYPVYLMSEKLNWDWETLDEESKKYIIENFGNWDLLDGYHRLLKAWFLRRRYIYAIEITKDVLEKSRYVPRRSSRLRERKSIKGDSTGIQKNRDKMSKIKSTN
jgi:hypothetical protein